MKWKDIRNQIITPRQPDKQTEEDFIFEISEMLIEARVRKGLTQQDLALKVGTKQPGIARIENGSSLPTLTFLLKIAKALGTHLLPPKFAFLKDYSPLSINQTQSTYMAERNFVFCEIQKKSPTLTKYKANSELKDFRTVDWIN